MPECPHHSLYWYASPCTEQGWKCADCRWQPGEPPGFSPQYDRSHLRTKVECIMHDLYDAEIIYVSNGDHGDHLTSMVATHCQKHDLYDSVSIARVILELMGDAKHAKFWRDISEGIIAGKDPRPRCHCGQLAKTSRGKDQACSIDHLPGGLLGEPF